MIRYPSSCFAIYVCITRLSEVWEVNMYSYTIMYALVTYIILWLHMYVDSNTCMHASCDVCLPVSRMLYHNTH